MAQVTTLSSAGVSAGMILNPNSKSTTVQLTVSSGSSSVTGFIQYTLDDPSTTPAPTVAWSNISSAIISSNADLGIGATFTLLSPIGGLRLSSSSTLTGTWTLKALQSVTA